MSNVKQFGLRNYIPVIWVLLIALLSGGCSESALGPVTDYSVRLLTYNIHHGANGSGVFDLDATVDTLRKSGATVIALQEVDRVWEARSNNIDEAEYIAEKLEMNYVFGATLDKDPASSGIGEYGIMILSKFPIVDGRFYLLPSQMEQRGMLLCSVLTADGPIPVACTHLGLSTAERQTQIAAMLEYLPRQADLVLMGDFNVRPEADELQPLKEPYSDLQEKYGLGEVGTYYYQNQWVRIDYIYGGRAWNPYYCKVMEDTSSDHRPVYVEIGRGD